MALGSLPTLTQISTEFGMPTGTSFFQLYRGGPYVPNITANNAISTSSSGVRLSQFPNTSGGDNVAVTQARYTIVVGSNWQDGFATNVPYGSHSGTVNGATMRAIYQSRSEFKGAWTYQFVIMINGTRAQSFWTQATLLDVAGDPVLLSSNATYSQESGYAQWVYFLGSIYSEWDGSGVQNVLFT